MNWLRHAPKGSRDCFYFAQSDAAPQALPRALVGLCRLAAECQARRILDILKRRGGVFFIEKHIAGQKSSAGEAGHIKAELLLAGLALFAAVEVLDQKSGDRQWRHYDPGQCFQ